MKRTMALIMVITIAGFLFSGCGSSPAAKFYTLTPLTQQAQDTRGVNAWLAQPIIIGPVEIPEYLDRHEIVIRSEQNQLILSEFNLWGGSLKADVNRVLMENISYFLASEGIPVVTWKIGAADAFRLPVQIVRFDGAPNNDMVLKARWSVVGRDGKAFELVRESNISVPVRGGNHAAIVAAMSDALGELAKEIASGIKPVVLKK
jgi:hypothetical protein